jgi:hypothetical protein
MSRWLVERVGSWVTNLKTKCPTIMESRSYGKQSGNFLWADSFHINHLELTICQCTKSVYPFHDGKFEDFDPVFKYLIAVSDHPPRNPYSSNRN